MYIITLNSTMPAFLKAHLALACKRLFEILFPDFLHAHRHVQRCCSNFSEMMRVCLQVESLGEVLERESRVGMSGGRGQDWVLCWEPCVCWGSCASVAVEDFSFLSPLIDCLMFLSEQFSINFIKFSSAAKPQTPPLSSARERFCGSPCGGGGCCSCWSVSFDCLELAEIW